MKFHPFGVLILADDYLIIIVDESHYLCTTLDPYTAYIKQYGFNECTRASEVRALDVKLVPKK